MAIEDAIDRLGSLGGQSIQSIKLLKLLSTMEASTEEVGQLLDADPILALRVLRVANSAFYGQRRQIGTVSRAIAILGFDAVRSISAAACLDQALARHSGTREAANKLLRHSLFSALAAQQLSVAEGTCSPGDAFMVGLLHDVGSIAWLIVTPEPWVPDQKHDTLSGRLLERWHLPEALASVVGQHHSGHESAARDPALLRVLRRADALALTADWSHDLDLTDGELRPVALDAATSSDMNVLSSVPDRAVSLLEAMTGS